MPQPISRLLNLLFETFPGMCGSACLRSKLLEPSLRI